jgi:hypothetical protein
MRLQRSLEVVGFVGGGVRMQLHWVKQRESQGATL